LHYSPSGGIERVVAALLEETATMETPRLPTWLSPTQVRLVPVGEEHVDYCDELVDELAAADVRADVDDRSETVGKRIARAETDWVPYYAVVGDRELDSGRLDVNVRAEDAEVELTPEELRDRVREETEGLPRKRRYLPRHVGDHPSFTGR
jgi:threonyl-tRNA synthetase